MKKVLLLIVFLSISLGVLKFLTNTDVVVPESSITQEIVNNTPLPTRIRLQTPLSKKTLENNYHIFQTFNNCGPAALSMTLSYFGINESQEKLGNDLRPYQNPQGDNDDKSVTLDELADKAKEYGLIPYHRPNGNIELIKKFITYDIPIITRTWTKVDEDIGHFRIIKGFDDESGRIIQDDSLQGKNSFYSYETFNKLWEKFNYEYLVLAPKEKQDIAEAILGNDLDEKTSWIRASQNAEKYLNNYPDDIYVRFNLSVALKNMGDYKRSVEEFEMVEDKLPFRTLWYQIEPIGAYFELGDDDRVIDLTSRILGYYNRAFSELYILRGMVYIKQSEVDLAKEEFSKAVFYNKNMKKAREALDSLN